MKYSVSYYDRNPIDPQARFDIKRTIVWAASEGEVRDEMELSDKEVISIQADTVPTYDEVLNGAKLSDEHRAQLNKWWNEKYDFAPIPSDMPIIDMNNIQEIPF